jgi:methyltransferase-like protein
MKTEFEDEIVIVLLKKYNEEIEIRPHERAAITDKYACMITCYMLGRLQK